MSISKILTYLCSIIQSIKIKDSCRYCLQRYSSERVLVDHKETCLEINHTQAVKLKRGTVKFRNYSKQLAVADLS